MNGRLTAAPAAVVAAVTAGVGGPSSRTRRKLTREGTRVRFGRSIYVPEDEICFFVFDALLARDVALAAQRAGLEPLRVVEAVPSGKE